MAKKEASNLEDELNDELLGSDDDFLSEEKDKTSTSDASGEFADKLSESLELEENLKDWKYLEFELFEEGDNEYLLYVKHQSHGYMNYMVSKILKVKGVRFAAYKNTSLEEPKMIIKLDGTKEIKKVLLETIKMMQIELTGFGNAISSMEL